MAYITPKEFLETMQWNQKVFPNKNNNFTLEALVLDTNFNRYYFENENLTKDDVTVYYDNSGTYTLLAEDTDYTINLEKGYLELTTTGSTKVGSSQLFSEYSYNMIGVSSNYISELLKRATSKVDATVNSTFVDGSQDNPNYPSKELNTSNKGFYDRYYYPVERPVIDITSNLAADVGKLDTTIVLKSNSGRLFPPEGKILINREIIEYTSISGDTMTIVRGDTPQEHKKGDIISTTMIEVSNEFEGLQIIRYPFDYEYKVLTRDEEFTITNSGVLYLYQHPRNFRVTREIEGRVTMRYLYGYTSIPEDIKRLTFLLAKKELTSTTIGRSLIEGRDEFNPEMFNFDAKEIEGIVNEYKVIPMTNT